MSLILDALKKLQKSKISAGGLPIRPYSEGRRDFLGLSPTPRYLILGTFLAAAVVIAAFASPLRDVWTKMALKILPEKKPQMAAVFPLEKKPAPPLPADKEIPLPQEPTAPPAPEQKKERVAASREMDKKPSPVKAAKPAIPKLKKEPVPSDELPGKTVIPSLPSPLPQTEEKKLEGKVVVKTIKDLPHYFHQGVSFQNQKDFFRAIAAYEEVLRIDPTYAEAYNNLGIIYNQIGNFEKAVFHLQKAIAADPNYFKAYNNLGVIFYQNGHFKEAEDQFRKAIQIHPKNMESYVNLALVCRKQQNLELALRILQKAFAIDPESPEVSYHWGLVAEEKGEVREAIDHYQRFLRLSPEGENALAQKVREHVRKLQRQVEVKQK